MPSYNDTHLFEMLILEGAQAGLSWLTILRKREHYRVAFDGFDAEKIARYPARKVNALLQDPGIVRNRLKIQSAVTNARACLDILESENSLAEYLWQFVAGAPVTNHWHNMQQVPATTPTSDLMSKTLRQRGFKFVGSTICYAYMQAVGMVNDHLVTCPRHRACAVA